LGSFDKELPCDLRWELGLLTDWWGWVLAGASVPAGSHPGTKDPCHCSSACWRRFVPCSVFAL